MRSLTEGRDLTVAGAAAILLAFGIVMMMRSHKKRSEPMQREPGDIPFDGSSDQSEYRVMTHISANNAINDNPFLTESEKAIVTRAASPDGEPNVSVPSHRLPCGSIC